ncbi:MAG: transporter substrate-binding domain-containing protein [Campylobacterales bacterium]|nr:transporter substrate-binding domain-containing protein [Campylobacterales bacterium]
MTLLSITQTTAATCLLANTSSLRGIFKPLILLFFPLFLFALPSETTIKTLGLTPKEVQWLASNPIIRLGFDPARPPYDFADEHGRHQGILSSYFHHFETVFGITFVPVRTPSWEMLLKEVEQGKIDVLSNIIPTKERTNTLLFSDPLFDVSLSVATNRDKVVFESLLELHGQRVGMVKGYATIPLVQHRYPTLHITEVSDLKKGLELLQKGELDAFIGEDFALQYYLKAYEFRSLYLAHPLPIRFSSHIGVHHDQPILFSLLQKALRAITHEQKQAFWLPWIKKENAGFHATGFLFAMLVLALFTLVWVLVLLRRQREKIIAILHRKKMAQKHLHIASTFLGMGTWAWSVSKNTYVVNPAYARLLGYEKKEFNETFEHFTSLISPEDLPLMFTALKRHLDGTEPYYNVHMRMRHKNGEYLWIRSCGKVLKQDANGHPELLGGWHLRVDEVNHQEEILSQHIDPVTTLFSSQFYKVLVPLHILRARREHKGVALFLFEFSNLSHVQETYGSRQTDEALKALSLVLQGQLTQPSGMLFRMNTTTFCMLFWFSTYKETKEWYCKTKERLQSIELFADKTPLVLSIHSGEAFMFPGSYLEEADLYQNAYSDLKKHQSETRGAS